MTHTLPQSGRQKICRLVKSQDTYFLIMPTEDAFTFTKYKMETVISHVSN